LGLSKRHTLSGKNPLSPNERLSLSRVQNQCLSLSLSLSPNDENIEQPQLLGALTRQIAKNNEQ